MILSGLPELVRENDQFNAIFTVRNATEKKMKVLISGETISGNSHQQFKIKEEMIEAGKANEIFWPFKVPSGQNKIEWIISAQDSISGVADKIVIKQNITEQCRTSVYQSEILQLENYLSIPAGRPKEALASKGGLRISLNPKLISNMNSVQNYMREYPYSCLEQKISKAIVLKNLKLWESINEQMPNFFDRDGLLKFYSSCDEGSDYLTAYALAISDEANLEYSENNLEFMLNAMKKFVYGKIYRYSAIPAADLSIRKISAIEALTRYGEAKADMIESIIIDPNLWPTSTIIEWINILKKIDSITGRNQRFFEAVQILNSRLSLQGAAMIFSEKNDNNLWWLNMNTDINSAKCLSAFLKEPNWRDVIPKLARGIAGRQKKGSWASTTANAWCIIALEKFSAEFESSSINGTTECAFGNTKTIIKWPKKNETDEIINFNFQKDDENLFLNHIGSGKLWASIQCLAAVPLKKEYFSGYSIVKTITPVEQKIKNKFYRGDIIKIRLDIEAQADMTWVAINDPIPGGSSILSTGLNRNSILIGSIGQYRGKAYPVFTERGFESFKAYYDYIPKGSFSVEYILRLNNSGIFVLPQTRVEAMYNQDMFGAIPNQTITVCQ